MKRLSYSTTRNLIKEAGYSRKRAKKYKTEVNMASVIEKRFERAFFFAKFLFTRKKIIYIDESSFNTDMEGLYGYSRSGKDFSVEEIILAAIGEEKIYGFCLFKGSVKGKDFAAFILNLIKEYDEIKKD